MMKITANILALSQSVTLPQLPSTDRQIHLKPKLF